MSANSKDIVIVSGARTPMAEWIGGKRGDGLPGRGARAGLRARPRRRRGQGRDGARRRRSQSDDHVIMGMPYKPRAMPLWRAARRTQAGNPAHGARRSR